MQLGGLAPAPHAQGSGQSFTNLRGSCPPGSNRTTRVEDVEIRCLRSSAGVYLVPQESRPHPVHIAGGIGESVDEVLANFHHGVTVAEVDGEMTSSVRPTRLRSVSRQTEPRSLSIAQAMGQAHRSTAGADAPRWRWGQDLSSPRTLWF